MKFFGRCYKLCPFGQRLGSLPYVNRGTPVTVCRRFEDDRGLCAHPITSTLLSSILANWTKREHVEDCLRAYRGYELDFSFLPSTNWDYGYFIQEGLIGYLRCENEWSEEEDEINRPAWRIRLCNPFTRSWRDLPAVVIPDEFIPYEELVDYAYTPGMEGFWWRDLIEEQKWRFSLRVYRDSCNSLQFELLIALATVIVDTLSVSEVWSYSSSTDLWSVTKIDFVIEEGVIESTVLCGGYLYCLTVDKNLNIYSLLDGKLCGRQAMDKYCFPETQKFSHSNDCHCGCDLVLLLECQGDVLGVEEFPTASLSPSFGIWKLNLSTMKWGEITIMPQDVYDAFVSQVLETDDITHQKKLFSLYTVSTVGEYVCLILSDYERGSTQISFGGVTYHLLTCHIPTRTWQVGFAEPQVPFDGFTPRLDIIL